jgi:EmrB/QacA subfamily drug resistance transporter
MASALRRRMRSGLAVSGQRHAWRDTKRKTFNVCFDTSSPFSSTGVLLITTAETEWRRQRFMRVHRVAARPRCTIPRFLGKLRIVASVDYQGEAAHADLERDAGEPDPHRRRIFAIVSLGLFMASVDGTIVATALHPIGSELHSTINWTAWTVTIYQLGQIVAMPMAGKISDQFGRKNVYLISAAIFTASSLACGLSTNIYMLIAFRLIQSLGGGAFMPSASGIVSDHFGRDRDKALGMFTSIFPIGGIVGPVFGGIIAQDWSWRGIFFINLPIGVVLIILGLKYIPQGARRPSASVDLRGVILLAGTILSGMLAITTLGSDNVEPWDPRCAGPLALGCLLGCLFVRHSRRSAAPFIPVKLLWGRGFFTMNAVNLLYGTSVLGFSALVPLYAQNRYHIQIASAGTLLSARALGMICLAALAATAMRRTGYRLPMIVGFLAIATGLVMLAIHAPTGIPPYGWLAGWSLLTGLGMGVAAPATNNASLQLAPDQVAQIAGLRGMFRMSGGILCVSVTTALLARSHNPGLTQAHTFLVEAAVMVVLVGLVFLVPDHKGRW